MPPPPPTQAVNLAEKLTLFDEHWPPRTVAQFNGHDVMVVKVKGEFVWHHHDDTDDFFLVLTGRLTIRQRDRDVTLGPGELFVVPVGVEHQPVAQMRPSCCRSSPAGHRTPATSPRPRPASRWDPSLRRHDERVVGACRDDDTTTPGTIGTQIGGWRVMIGG